MTEREKMQHGLLHNANYDAELLAARAQCKDLCFAYNQLNPSLVTEQEKLMRRLLGKTGKQFFITAPFWCDYGTNIEIGENFYTNHNCIILDGAKVTFGDNVFIGPNCTFSTSGHPLDPQPRNQGLEYAYPITIGHNVWIGASVTVLPGVTIGSNTVIGAGSVVNRDIQDGVIAVGNPCRVLGKITEKKETLEEWNMKFDPARLEWTRQPKDYIITPERIEIVTQPHTDLWQRTYYHFRNDNAPVLQMKTEETFFSFVVKTEFSESNHRFDQCGVVVYLDSENWLKASVEYENETFQHLGSVVTNHGYSDWATTEIPAGIKSMWYRLSRREDDFCIEHSEDGILFHQMRICHLCEAKREIRFGIYACSPEDSSFRAVFTNMELTECKWLAHNGQAPDEEF